MKKSLSPSGGGDESKLQTMAKLSCDSLIAQDISIPCEDQVTKGLESDSIIMNRGDIDFSKTTFDEDNPNIIKQLVLKTGKKAYACIQQGNTPYTGTKSELNVGTYRNTWTHELPIVVLANTPDVVKNIIDGLANGKFVAIVRNVSKGADGKGEFQVYGYAQGLKASAGTNEKYSDDTEGGWLITLQEEQTPKAALFFFNTDTDTTTAAYESLKSGV